MAVSRRRFLHQGVFAAVCYTAVPAFGLGQRRLADGGEDGAQLPVLPRTSDRWQDHASALESMDRSAFTGAVGSSFKVVGPGAQPVWTTLQSVKDLPKTAVMNPGSMTGRVPSPAPINSNGFMLVFGGTQPLAQGTYLFEQDALGRFALFVVPEPGGQATAVVARLNEPVIIATPFAREKNGANRTAGAASIRGTNAPPISSGREDLSPVLSETPAVRKILKRD